MCLFCIYFLLKGGNVIVKVSFSGSARRKEVLPQTVGRWRRKLCNTVERRLVKSASSVSRGTGGNPGRTIVFKWNCRNLEETNLTSRLKRHGPNSSRSSTQTEGPNKGRNQVAAGRVPCTACPGDAVGARSFAK